MRPLKLRMKGFGAFRADTEVDFTDVERAALIGPTGSGKSTIIDGITFALFGSVARYDDARAVAPVVNQLDTEARVALDFEVGGEQFRAVRVVRRTTDGATTKEARLECGETVRAGQAREMGDAVERLLGLDFDRFTKTVVLPQGRFARFLHDKASDRQALLRDLLDLGIYTRMGSAARDRAGTADAQVKVLEPDLAAEAPTDEEVAALEAAVEATLCARARLEKLMAALADARSDVAAARDEAARLNPLRQRAVDASTVPDDVRSLTDQSASAKKLVTQADEWATAARAAATEARQQAEDGPNAEVCRKLLRDHRNLAKQQSRLSALQAEAREALHARDSALEAGERLRGQLDAADAKVAEARAAASAADSAARQGPDRGEIGRIRAKRDEMDDLAGRLAQADMALKAAEEEEASARARHNEARTELDSARGILDQVRSVKQADGLVAQLKEGEPCPVCRQVVAALPEHDIGTELREAQATHDRAGSAERAARGALDESRESLAVAAAEADSIMVRHRELESLLGAGPDEEELDRLEAHVERLAAAVRAAQQRLAAAESAEVALKTADETKRILDDEKQAERAHEAATSRLDEARSHCQDLAARLSGEADEAILEAEIERAAHLARARVEAEDAERSAENDASAAQAELHKLKKREGSARRQHLVVRDGLAALSPPQPSGSLLEDWDSLAAWADQQAAELDGRIQGAGRQQREAQARRDGIVEDARDACAPHELGDDPDSFTDVMAVAAVKAEGARDKAVEERERHAELQERVDGLRDEAAVAAELGRLLQSNGFERWLLEEAVAALVERANQHLLVLSGGQYSFVADETSFNVCDHHNADEVRGARTLSGGETFLASLSLALALRDGQAEIAAEGAARLDSLFLDEGFGTLDPDALDVVTGAIEEISSHGRMVCVVTHIREVAERMDVCFEVSKGATTSSVERREGDR